jgi:transcription elongation factor Elf1
MSGMDCPYCNHENDEPDEPHPADIVFGEECENCGKTFGFQFVVSYHYETFELPCSNGHPHKWKKIIGVPAEYFKDKYRCTYCAEEKIFSEQAFKKMEEGEQIAIT